MLQPAGGGPGLAAEADEHTHQPRPYALRPGTGSVPENDCGDVRRTPGAGTGQLYRLFGNMPGLRTAGGRTSGHPGNQRRAGGPDSGGILQGRAPGEDQPAHRRLPGNAEALPGRGPGTIRPGLHRCQQEGLSRILRTGVRPRTARRLDTGRQCALGR